MSKSFWADIPAILALLRKSEHILLALDFDGTLAPIADRPEQAEIPGETAGLLRELAVSEGVFLAIVSGRSLVDLKHRVKLDCIHVGNHGLEIEGKGISFAHDGAGLLRYAINDACWDLEAALEGVRGVFVERKGLTATVHYRLAPSDLVGWIETSIQVTMRPYASRLTFRAARRAWEIGPRINWNKGSALKFVLRQIGMVEPLVICAGDDATDEDMFNVLPDAISIQVGDRCPTAARYHVAGPAQLATFLGTLAPLVRLHAEATGKFSCP